MLPNCAGSLKLAREFLDAAIGLPEACQHFFGSFSRQVLGSLKVLDYTIAFSYPTRDCCREGVLLRKVAL